MASVLGFPSPYIKTNLLLLLLLLFISILLYVDYEALVFGNCVHVSAVVTVFESNHTGLFFRCILELIHV